MTVVCTYVYNGYNMMQVFEFADRHRGAYSSSLRSAVCPFYCDVNGYQVRMLNISRWICIKAVKLGPLILAFCWLNLYYNIVQDELLWAAAWLHKASRRREYREYIAKNEVILRAGDTINEFGWDNKHAGINVLISKVTLITNLRNFNYCTPR